MKVLLKSSLYARHIKEEEEEEELKNEARMIQSVNKWKLMVREDLTMDYPSTEDVMERSLMLHKNARLNEENKKMK